MAKLLEEIESPTVKSDDRLDLGKIMKRFLQVGFQLLILAAALFLSSWHWDWGMAWAFLGVSAAVVTVGGIGLLRINPALVAERTRTGEGTKDWDRVLTALYGLTGTATLVVAGLDARFGWSGGISLTVSIILVRTVAEDRTLQGELPGYREYARQTRYRLLPGVW